MNHYALLNIQVSATQSSIRKAYKNLALQLHPDRNNTSSATAEFQQLGLAWEILRDPVKRAEYDKTLPGGLKRKHSNGGEGGEGEVEETLEDVLEPQSRRKDWTSEGWEVSSLPNCQEGGEDRRTLDQDEYMTHIRLWKSLARDDYLYRLDSWTASQKEQISVIVGCLRSIHKAKVEFERQHNGSEEFWNHFYDISEQDQSASARQKIFIEDLERQFNALVLALEASRRKYEEVESQARQNLIKEALQLLRSQSTSNPLFNDPSRLGRTIRYWQSLSRIKHDIDFSYALKAGPEGPWHSDGEWKRKVGEHVCGRCTESMFSIVAEFGMATCPGCGVLVCDTCFRDLLVLRQYEAWITDEDENGNSLFCLGGVE